MRKIFSFLLICILVLAPILQTSANYINDEKKIAVKNILVTKSQLKKISKGEQYIEAMDNFVSKISDNNKKVDTVKAKIDNAVYALENKQWSGKLLTPKERQLLSILKYLQARLKFTQLDNLSLAEQEEESKLDKLFEEIKNPSITPSDKEKLETAIISIQKNLLEKSKQSTKEILGDFEDYFNYETKGDFEMNLKMDHESIGNINAEFKLSDYVTQASNFDSRFNGHISAMINALPKGEDAVKGEFSSFVDFISKDGQIYALVKDLNITTEENLEEFQDMLDTLKTLASENKYIEFPNTGEVEAIELIKSFHPDNFFHDADKLFSKPMFTAYKKEGEVFHMIPTKYACDSLKVLANKFDPFSPNNCTQSQYDEIVEELITQGELTMTLGNENVMKYSYTADHTVDIFDVTLTFTDSSINKFDINIIADQERFKNEKFVLNYEKNKELNMTFYAEEGDINVQHKSSLDSRNNFSSLEHTGYIKDWNDEITWDLGIKNRKINGNFKVESPKTKYNYQTREYDNLGTEFFEASIKGNTDSRNELNNLIIDYTGNDGERDYLTGQLIYNLPELKFIANFQDDYGNAKINFDGKWNTRNQNFDNFDAKVEVAQKQRTFDYETYTYNYADEEEKVFDLDYSLNNSNIEGTLNAYNSNQVVFGVVTQGTYKKDQLQLDNELKVDFLNTYFGQIERARDTTRVSDIYLLSTAVEQYYQDNAEYPTKDNFKDAILTYVSSIPSDPSGNIEINGCKFGYKYEVGEDINAIKNQSYNLSTCFESSKSVNKAEYDNGKYDNRFEKGNYINQTMDESFYINGYTSWNQQETVEPETPIIHINFGYDYTSNKTNSELYIDAIYEEEKVFEMNMKNTGNIEYKKVDIQAPSETVPMEDVIETNNYYY